VVGVQVGDEHGVDVVGAKAEAGEVVEQVTAGHMRVALLARAPGNGMVQSPIPTSMSVRCSRW
jgi:pyridoxine 5'-phosphate synthase PdxJ